MCIFRFYVSVYFLCLHNSYVYLHHVCILLFAGPYKMVDAIVKERVCMLYVYVFLFCGYIVVLPCVYFLQMSVSFSFHYVGRAASTRWQESANFSPLSVYLLRLPFHWDANLTSFDYCPHSRDRTVASASLVLYGGRCVMTIHSVVYAEQITRKIRMAGGCEMENMKSW